MGQRSLSLEFCVSYIDITKVHLTYTPYPVKAKDAVNTDMYLTVEEIISQVSPDPSL